MQAENWYGNQQAVQIDFLIERDRLIKKEENEGEHQEKVPAVRSPPEPVCGYGHQDDGKYEQDEMHDVVLV